MAIETDGTLRYAYTASTPVTAPPFTLACWAYPETDAAGSSQTLISLTDDSDYYLIDLYRPAGNIRWARAIAQGQASIKIGYTVGNWHHITGTFYSSGGSHEIKVYLDGAVGTTQTDDFVADTTPDKIRLAAQYVGGSPVTMLDGYLAEIAIWDEILTADEIASLAKGYSPLMVSPQNLKVYWPMISNRGAPLAFSYDRMDGLYLNHVGGAPVTADHPPVIYPN